MGVMCCNEIVGFDAGKVGLTDNATQINYIRYCRLRDAESVNLKKMFFAVLIHGWVNAVGGEDGLWDAKKLIAHIEPYYRSRGKNRAILMISCFTGYGVARKVALNFKVPVVAPLAAAYINDVGQILTDDIGENRRNPTGQGYHINDNQRWNYFLPSGFVGEVTPFPVLQKPKACEIVTKNRFIF